MAQGVQKGETAGNDLVTGKEYYTDTLNYPVSVQFDAFPESLLAIKPTRGVLTIYCGVPNGTKSTGYVSGHYYANSVGSPAPSDAELKQQHATAGLSELDGKIKLSKFKTDILNGYVSLVSTPPTSYLTVPGSKSWGTIKREPIYEDSPYPGIWSGQYSYEMSYTITFSGYKTVTENISTSHAYEYIANGMILQLPRSTGRVYSPTDSTPAYLELTYDEQRLLTYLDSPSGYVDETGALRFAWHTTWVGFPVENIAQTSATLQWRNGTSGTIHSIAISGDVTEYTMPANTLPQSQEIQWRVLAETVEGSAESSWRSLQTEDSYPTVKGISPAGIYVDGTDVVRFVWEYASDTGAPQKRYDLQYKTNTSDWIDLRSETSADAFSDVPAGVLPAGAIQWRVRGYNQDDIASAWSDPLSAIVISAPASPTVTVTSVSPRPTVSWTAIDQQAYQVRFGTYDTGTLFGTTKTMKSPVFLPDGRTSVYVRVMNLYGFWSPWGTASLTVANIPSETALNLNVSGTQDAVLSWTEDTNAAGYHIYRNGEKIAETNQTTYTDRYSIGQTSYFVRAIYSGNDYYTDSKTVAVTLSTDCPIITATDGDWVRLEHTTTALPTVQISSTQAVGMMTYNGTDYPVPELSPHRTRTYILNAAFKDVSEALRFEALIGRVCCLKDQYGNRIVGMISNVTRAHSRFYTVCTATLNEIGGEVL